MAGPDVEVSPSDLRFRFQLNKQLLATININNPSSQRVAFKIKTTAPKKYVVRPSSGVVESGSNVSIQVIMQAQKEYAAEFANCKDKFMVQTTVLGESEQIEKDTFNKDVRKDLKEYRLRVTIEGPAAPPSPVPEANEADDEATAVRSAAVPPAAPVLPLAPTAAAEPAVDPRVRNALDNLHAATVENQQLKGQVERLQRERDELRRQLDSFQLQGAALKTGAAAPQQAAAAPKPQVPLAIILLAAIIAFLLGHYMRF
ncbi:hypothetical protein VOLCADRAFT_107060 [Volvox carteri f. nagariensis]|uniref:MSP domain-containing protein n=1 Tax=Volvox carteri f. nagariensis TaxID=3068 RepID=D8UBR9_VOLCA|nr:uncharacterized protein VOLCADRAFT_107060 [Volvox carteri f. nagariensis]EFJ42815.1 hypothetical protein VOLCADRAFT_107060 [Volvox carteri f. nagariensis]|eukprot:XP_002956075.1 hypothetical protein VOLCADRAFT_107060 [Volvox carteri f. nagariensis]